MWKLHRLIYISRLRNISQIRMDQCTIWYDILYSGYEGAKELGVPWGNHIPYTFPIKSEAKELPIASQPSTSIPSCIGTSRNFSDEQKGGNSPCSPHGDVSSGWFCRAKLQKCQSHNPSKWFDPLRFAVWSPSGGEVRDMFNHYGWSLKYVCGSHIIHSYD